MFFQVSLPPHENVIGCHGSAIGGPQGAPRGPQGPVEGGGEVLLLLDYCNGGNLLDLMNRMDKPAEGLDERVIKRVLLHVARFGFTTAYLGFRV